MQFFKIGSILFWVQFHAFRILVLHYFAYYLD